MTNKIVLKTFAQKICDFAYNEDAIGKIEKIKPKSDTSILEAIRVWKPKVEEKLQKLMNKLPEGKEKNTVKQIHKTFYFEGSQQFFEDLVPQTGNVLSHNDV